MTGNNTADRPQRGTIIEMQRFVSGTSLSPLRQAEAYWTALRKGSGIPLRSQIDPRGLENLLPSAFIVERIAPTIARFRLAGQTVTGLAGMEVRGMPLSALFTPGSRNRIGATLEAVFDTPAVAELSLLSETRHFRTAFEARMILLPLKTELGDISRALGVLVSDKPATEQSPVRFDMTGSLVRPVTGLHYPENERPAAQAETAPGFSAPEQRPFGRAPHLKLVKTSD